MEGPGEFVIPYSLELGVVTRLCGHLLCCGLPHICRNTAENATKARTQEQHIGTADVATADSKAWRVCLPKSSAAHGGSIFWRQEEALLQRFVQLKSELEEHQEL